MGVDDFNAAKRLLALAVNTAQRSSMSHANTLQRNSTLKIQRRHYPTESSTIAIESVGYPLTIAAGSVLSCALMNLESANVDLPTKRKRYGGGRAFHSQLEPFVELIREQRQRRRTWKEIAAALSSEKICVITAQGVHQFYRRYLQRRAKGHWDEQAEPFESQPARLSPAASRPQSRPAPLPPAPKFNRPDRSNLNTEEFT
jgi:hypothetical protein